MEHVLRLTTTQPVLRHQPTTPTYNTTREPQKLGPRVNGYYELGGITTIIRLQTPVPSQRADGLSRRLDLNPITTGTN